MKKFSNAGLLAFCQSLLFVALWLLVLAGGETMKARRGKNESGFTLNGQVQFHYDESLRDNPSVTSGYVVVAWQALCLQGGTWVAE